MVTKSSREGQFFGHLDSHELHNRLKRLREETGVNGTLIDIGTNLGAITNPLADAGFNTLSFGPMPKNLHKLKLIKSATTLSPGGKEP